jgi:SanA protein
MKKKKLFLWISLSLVIGGLLSLFLCNQIIVHSAAGKMYTDTNEIPYHKVGLLLGTSKTLANGYNNPYYVYRIQAAVALFKAQKIKYIVVSGDNGRSTYNEPEAMRADLMEAGIDSSNIYLDYAGFRTFDSIKRLKEIFGQDAVTVISQQFHNERAIYIAQREGIEAVGFNAQDVSKGFGFRTAMRERFARVKVFVDYILGTKPKYLGSKVIIPS